MSEDKLHEILRLYDTFLGRFKFYRQFILLLKEFYFDHNKQVIRIEELEQEVSTLHETIELYHSTDTEMMLEMQSQIGILQSQPPKKVETSRDMSTHGTEIMQRAYLNYLETGEAK